MTINPYSLSFKFLETPSWIEELRKSGVMVKEKEPKKLTNEEFQALRWFCAKAEVPEDLPLAWKEIPIVAYLDTLLTREIPFLVLHSYGRSYPSGGSSSHAGWGLRDQSYKELTPENYSGWDPFTISTVDFHGASSLYKFLPHQELIKAYRDQMELVSKLGRGFIPTSYEVPTKLPEGVWAGYGW